MTMTMSRARSTSRSVIFYLFTFIILCCFTKKHTSLDLKSFTFGLESLEENRKAYVAGNLKRSDFRMKPSTVSDAISFGLKSHRLLKIFKIFLLTQLIILSGDIMVNPGPSNIEYFDQSSILDNSFSSMDSEQSNFLFASQFHNSSMNSRDEDEFFYDLGLPGKGLRVGHRNVNYLTTSKFEQIKLILTNKDGNPQVDVLFISETFLKPDVPDCLYNIPGFNIFRKDRVNKNGGGVMAFVNKKLSVIHRTDLEDIKLEILWLEIAPFKSKRSLLLAGIYRPPSSTKADDIALEKNIEKVDLLNKETVLMGDLNIDALNIAHYNKHCISKTLKNLHFKQLVREITRPVSGTCLDHIHSNNPQCIVGIVCPNIGLSDHLPVFATRQYSRSSERNSQQKGNTYIKYRNMKNFDEDLFKSTLKQTPWDSAFIFDDVDDILSSWESLFNNTLDANCPWRVKRVSKTKQSPWLSSSVTKQLRERDRLLKIARRSGSVADWESYKKARNKAVSIVRKAKSEFFKTTFKNNQNNPKGMWKTIKSLMGDKRQTTTDHKNIISHGSSNTEMANSFNEHFSTIAERLREQLQSAPFDISKLENFVRSRKDENVLFLYSSNKQRGCSRLSFKDKFQ